MSDQTQEGSPFETIRREDENEDEYWSARDLAKALGYTEYGKFRNALAKAEKACSNSNQQVADHFAHVSDMIIVGKGAKRLVEDVHLSRYACYLVVENADPSKPVVALGQTYFATKARKAELLEEVPRMGTYEQLMDQTRFLKGTAATVAGIVRARDFSVFQDHGYRGLYNGETEKNIHQRKGLKKSQEITDYMGRAELAANWFHASQADLIINRLNITDPQQANRLNYELGKETREAIKRMSNIMPEDMPTPTDSIQKVKRKRLKPGPAMPEFGKPPEDE